MKKRSLLILLLLAFWAPWAAMAQNISVTGTTTINCGSTTQLTASGVSGANYYWYSDAACTQLVGTGATLITPTLTDNATYYVKAVNETITEGTPQTFSYTGSQQTYTIPSNVRSLKLEVWGAQGGYRSSSTYGGKGGYSIGTYNDVTPGQTLYVHVGGSGNSGTSSSSIYAGGYNGGGYRYGYHGGGGATHIATASGLLKSLTSNRDAVLIVAGGGGSDGASSKQGMYGGGTSGGSSSDNYTANSSYCGKGGTQDYSGYSSAYTITTQATSGLTSNTTANYCGGFGFGGGGVYLSSGYGGAGGGGWYGGSGTVPDGSSDDDRGGGGGSGYIKSTLTNAQTIGGNSSMTNPSGGTMTGREGHGYARITPNIVETTDASDPVSVTVTVIAPSASFSVGGNTTIVCGNTTTLTASGAEGMTYFWYSDAECTQLVGTGATLTTPALTANTTYYVKAGSQTFIEGEAVPFPYTGSVQTYTIPSGVGALKLEVWGAQAIYSSASPSSSYTSGNGGYATGTMTNLTGVSTLYVYVGGKPGSSVNGSSSYYNGGWNGGGGKPSASTNDNGPGGGATDICLTSSSVTLSNYRYIRTDASYKSRLIVAGGGGGGRTSTTDAAGGYVPGATLAIGSSNYYGTMTAAGTNSSNYIEGGFGYGSSSNNTSDDRGCGGGGWYGGGSCGDSYGGGGSSFVWCDTYASYVPSGYTPTASMKMSDVAIYAGTQSMPAPAGSTETGHSGDGYARITAYFHEVECETDALAVTVILSQPDAPTDLQVSDITSTTATVTWDAGIESSWQYSTDGSNWTSTTSTTASLSGLTPNTLYTFQVKVVNSNCESSIATLQFTTLSVHTLTVNVAPEGSGTVTCNPTAANNLYDHGTVVTLSQVNATGYTFTNWTVDGVTEAGATCTVTMDGDHTVTANFTINGYTIAASSDPDGEGTISGAGSYNHYSSCTLTATPASGSTYVFAYWLENGTIVSYNASYTFEVSGPRTLVAHFVPTDINNTSDWEAFTGAISNGYNYSGVTVNLRSDISVTTMAGTYVSDDNRNAFSGTFDGHGNTITLTVSNQTRFAAPFKCVDGATIQNVKTAGSISGVSGSSADGKLLAGVVGVSFGSTVVRGCSSSMAISSNHGEDSAFAGIVAAHKGNSLLIEGCVFEGSMSGSYNSTLNWKNAGIMGYQYDNACSPRPHWTSTQAMPAIPAPSTGRIQVLEPQHRLAATATTPLPSVHCKARRPTPSPERAPSTWP